MYQDEYLPEWLSEAHFANCDFCDYDDEENPYYNDEDDDWDEDDEEDDDWDDEDDDEWYDDDDWE